MFHNAAAKRVGTASGAYPYQRHQPEQTLLYQIIEQHYPAFTAQLAERGIELPGYVQREFGDYLKCGRLEHGFLRVRCDTCHAEQLVAFSCKRRGFCPSCGARRMADDCMDAGGRAKQEPEPKARLCWWMKYYPVNRLGNGYLAFRFSCAMCSPASRRSWVRYCVSSTASSPCI